jgi:hypothetical protein
MRLGLRPPNQVANGEFSLWKRDWSQRETMNLIVQEMQFERAAPGLLAATDLAINLRKNYVAVLQCMQKYAVRLSEHSQAHASLLLQYLEKVSHARSVGDFANAARVLSEGGLELSSRHVCDLVTFAQKTTIIALDAGSATTPNPPAAHSRPTR